MRNEGGNINEVEQTGSTTMVMREKKKGEGGQTVRSVSQSVNKVACKAFMSVSNKIPTNETR